MNTAMTTMAFVGAVAATCAQAQFAPTGKFPAQPVTGQPVSIDPFQTTPANPVKTWGGLLGLPQTKPDNSGAGQGGVKKPLRLNERVVDPDQYEGIANKNSPEVPPLSSLEVLAKQENSSCNLARRNYEQLNNSMIGAFGRNFEDPAVARFIPAARMKAFFSAAAAFDRDCLASAESIPESLKAAGIDAFVGIIRNGDAAYCTGFRIRQNVIATARHCLFDRANNVMYRGFTPGGLSFSFAADGWQSHRVVQVVHGQAAQSAGMAGLPYGSDQDYLFLVTDSIQAAMPKLTFARDPKGREEVFVYGFFRNFDAAERAGLVQTGGVSDYGLRWTKAGGCIVGALYGPCIYHGCQTLEGFSGAPIIRRGSTAALEVLGIHVSGVGSDRVCPAELVSSIGNVALKLPEDLVNLASTGGNQ